MIATSISSDPGLLIFPVGAGVAALIFGIEGYLYYRGAKASRRWRPVQGVILLSRVTGTPGRPRVIFRPEIEYQYKATGRVYEGKRIYFGAGEWRKNDLARSNELVSRYPKGAQVQVYVDPARPDRAVLEPGVFEIAWLKLQNAAIAAALCAIFGYAAIAG